MTGRAELITQMELGTLFLVRSVHLYLVPGGKIAFVLPKSIFSADQHDTLRRNQVKKVLLSPIALWDLEHVSPLFKTSSAVYFGEKKKPDKNVSIPGEVIQGELPIRNAGLATSEERLTYQSVEYRISVIGKRSFLSTGLAIDVKESPYRDEFNNGACIYPRAFWFVDVGSSEFGFDENLPPLVSSQRAQDLAKKAYKGCVIEGVVESRLIFATLLPVDMVPFGHLRLRLILLPITITHDTVTLFDSDQAREAGLVHLANWLDKVQREWSERGGSQARNSSSLEYLNYRGKLTGQNVHAPFKAMYATSGTHVCACVLPYNAVRRQKICGLTPNGFAADITTYYLETETNLQAHYLASILNAPSVDQVIKPAQAKGLWGARHVHKKVLDLPIPRFNEKSANHLRLAEIGVSCATQVKKWIASGGPGNIRSIGVLRNKVREMLSQELDEIDSIVKSMLGL